MMISSGALLSEVYGSESLKKKKKNKNKDSNNDNNDNNGGPLNNIFPDNEKHIFPNQPEKINVFDNSFFEKSNVMPFGETMGNHYFNLDEKENSGGFYPVNTSPNNVKATKPPTPFLPPTGTPSPQTTQTQVKKEISSTLPITNSNGYQNIEQPPKQWVWDNGVKITEEEYKEFQEYRKFKSQQKQAMLNEQYEKSQDISNEGFANINDDFNDVLLFALLGIFFLLFTDYIYKLGRKSY
jgi:hypothetical protein